MATTMLSIKIDKPLKDKAQEVAHALGVSLNAILNRYLKELVSTRQVTFTDHPVLNKRSQKLLRRLSDDAHKGRNMIGPFYTAEDMIKSLRS